MLARSTFALALLAAPLLLFALLPSEPKETGPRLVVVVSIDQFAYDYLPRFRAKYAKDGFFLRVDREGANYVNCHHRHAFTITAPGHSVQLTVAYPAANGIIGNNWYDRKAKKLIYCVDDDAHPLVGRPPEAAAVPNVTKTGAEKPKGVSPARLFVPTVGEELKQQRPGAKLCGVSLKDRAAVLMCGHAGDTVVWFDETCGRWVTSTFYDKTLPSYVAAYNEGGAVKRYSGGEWKLSRPIEAYKLNYPDDAPFEGKGFGLGRAFPHPIAKLEGLKDPKDYYAQVALTPYGNDLTLEMVREVLVHEGLGKDAVPDLLCVNFSSNDYCGHNFGPDSLEVEEMCYQTDAQLARLTGWLDELVGKDRWTLLITADHGVCPIAEYRKEQGLPGSRDPLGGVAKFKEQLQKFLVQRFGPATTKQGYFASLETNELVLNKAEPAVAARQAEIEKSLVTFLRQHESIHEAVSRTELASGQGEGIKFYDAFRRTFHPKVSGDVLWCFKPYMYQSTTPATHGSPWPYDSHVPLLLLGRGIQPGVYERQTSPAAVAATVARLLGVKPPATCLEPGADEALETRP